jgi:hypothetical protein
MQTVSPSGDLDVLAIQNRNRKQAVPGAQGGYMPSSTSYVAGLGDSRGYTDPLFMPRWIGGAVGAYLLATGFSEASKSKTKKKSRSGAVKGAAGVVVMLLAYKLKQA